MVGYFVLSAMNPSHATIRALLVSIYCMETARSFESATETFAETLRTPETAIEQVSEELESRLEEVSETPDTCVLNGRTWECAGDTRRELIGQQQEQIKVAKALLQEISDANNEKAQGSPEQRATYLAIKWLTPKIGTYDNTLDSTLKEFEIADLEARAANTSAAPEEVEQYAT